MTREKLVEIISSEMATWSGVIGISKAADRIQAAFDDEKKGEIVVTPSDYAAMKDSKELEEFFWKKLNGKKYKLIFRPAGE